MALAAPAAQAGGLVSSAVGCADESLSQPFLQWADVAQYVLAPGGSAESADGWTLSGDAATVAGNEPWGVRAAGDSSSLRLGPGSSATTGSMCTGIDHPTLRFFASSSGAGLSSSLRVEVLFEDLNGNQQSLTVGRVGGGGWSPTAIFPVVANLLALLPDNDTAVAFRFTPEGTGSWRIDDVFVDPYGRH